jgi:hypothetical protein
MYTYQQYIQSYNAQLQQQQMSKLNNNYIN